MTPHFDGLLIDGHNIDIITPINVEVSVYNKDFTDNQISVFFYEELDYKNVFPIRVPANGQDPILIETDFKLSQNSRQTMIEKG